MRKILVALFLLLAGVVPALAADRPNVLFIAVDDLRPELGCYGGHAITPNLDALAKRAVLFDRAYCQQAVCSPSRTSMLTGRRPDTTKIYDLETHFRKTIPDVVTLPQYFKNNGYFTQSFGKIYHGKLNDPASWSVPHTPNGASQYSDPKTIAALKGEGADTSEVGGKGKGPAWEIADCADDKLPDGWIADHAIEALQKIAKKDQPFFLAVGFLKPHLPFVAPKRFFDLYPPEKIDLSPNPNAAKDAPELAFTNFNELRAYTNIPKGKAPLSEQQARELRRAYFAATSFMDSQAGRLLDELSRLRLRDNTIVVIWGDHGWHLGDEGMWTKHTNFEVATRAAFMLSAPNMKHAGERTKSLVEYVDVYPTLCELAGLKLPDGLEGTSFVPLLDDPSRAWKQAAFSQFPRKGEAVMGYSMRTDRYRYTEWVTHDSKREVLARELYDEQADPNETANVADKQSEVAKELSAQLSKGWRSAAP
jgi:iduronate 2-sulfatase